MRSSGRLPDFTVAPDVAKLGVRVLATLLVGVENRRSDDGFESLKKRSLEQLRSTLADDVWKADPVLRGFRELHAQVGLPNRDFQSASESLVRRFSRKGDLPSINLLVDIYNLVSVETRLALGAHDARNLAWPVTLRRTDGTERFVPIGAAAPEAVRAGEYAYVDEEEIICRLECKQVEKTRVKESSHDVFFILQGNPATPPAALESGWNRLYELTSRFCGGEIAAIWRNGED
jgi:DNA/RNA-binding domain of Phe-tRNA-synthetase-like protein